MSKRITAKVEEYQKDGQTKGKYVEIGVILSNDNGEYMILDPSISLSGVLQKQNVLAAKSGKPERGAVMCGIWEADNAAGGTPQQERKQLPPKINPNDNFDDEVPDWAR